MNILRVLRFAFVAMLLASAPALAESWRVELSKSSVSFFYTEDGKPKSGVFRRFSGGGEFDRRRPERARLRFEIDLKSILLEDALRTGVVKDTVWFDVKSHPKATYVLTSLKRRRGDQFVATGELTIKGTTRALTAPVRLNIDKRRARAVGEFEFDRFDFKVGDRIFDISDQVSVRFDLVATGE